MCEGKKKFDTDRVIDRRDVGVILDCHGEDGAEPDQALS